MPLGTRRRTRAAAKKEAAEADKNGRMSEDGFGGDDAGEDAWAASGGGAKNSPGVRASLVSECSTLPGDEGEDDFVELGGSPERDDDEASDVTACETPVSEDGWRIEESPTPAKRVEREAAPSERDADEEDMDGLETPEKANETTDEALEEDGVSDCGDDVNLGGTPEGVVEDEEEDEESQPNSQLMSPVDRFRRSNVEPRNNNTKPGGVWASIGSPMTAPFDNKALVASIDRETPMRPSVAKKRAAMRMSLPANVVPVTPIPISRQVLERIECLGPSLNIVQRMMLVVGILLDFYSKTQLIRELHRFARAGSWIWFSIVLTFFVFSAMCITGYWVLHYPMPPKPEPGSIAKDQKVFGFSKYDFKVIVRRFGAFCATIQLGTAFAAWRALRTNDVRARKAEMDLRGMQLVDTVFLTLPMATLQAYIGMSCSNPANACPGRDGFDTLLFFAVVGSITSGTLCFVSLDLHEKPPAYNWGEYWKMHKAHLSEMMAKACYRFFELSARICTIGLFAAVTGPYIILVFFLHACIILGLLKIRLPGVHDRKVWEKFCELREFEIFGRKWNLPVLDDMKLLVACLIWPPSSYVSNSADRKGKFWWRSTSCPRKSFWALTREDALIPFAIIIGVLAGEAGIMLMVISFVADEHYYSYLGVAVTVNFLWMISAVNWMSAAALWNPFVPEGPPLGYPSVSAINNAIGGRQMVNGWKKNTTFASPTSKPFSPSPAPIRRLPLDPVDENKLNTTEMETPVLRGEVSNSPSLGPRTETVMIKGSPKPVQVYVDMGDDSAELDVDDDVPPMVTTAIGEENMLRTSMQWRDSMDLDRTASGDMDVQDSQADLEAARDALNFLNTTEDGGMENGGTPMLASPAIFMDKENMQGTPEMGDEGVSPITVQVTSPTSSEPKLYSPR